MIISFFIPGKDPKQNQTFQWTQLIEDFSIHISVLLNIARNHLQQFGSKRLGFCHRLYTIVHYLLHLQQHFPFKSSVKGTFNENQLAPALLEEEEIAH